MSRNLWIRTAAVAALTVLMTPILGSLAAQTELPSAAEVREALATLRRFERALATDSKREGGASGVGEGARRFADGPLTSPSVAATPPPQVVTAPSQFSLNIDGDIALGGGIFKGDTSFLHSDAIIRTTAVGSNALVSVPALQGDHTSAFGHEALQYNTTGHSNTGIGSRALRWNTVGSFNTAVGSEALLKNESGNSNTAIGGDALGSNTTGDRNTAIGDLTLASNTSGYYNTAVGDRALRSNTSGYDNTAVGFEALKNNTGGILNTAIGFRAGYNWDGVEYYNIALGADVQGVDGETRTTRIGKQQTRAFIAGVRGITVSGGIGVFVNAGGQLGTSTSSTRFKQDIHDLNGVSDRLLGLRPVQFRYKDEFASGGDNPIEYGLLAEEVAKVFPELVVNDDEGKPYTVRYHLLTPLLLGEVQRQEGELASRESEVAELQVQVADLRRRLDELAENRSRR